MIEFECLSWDEQCYIYHALNGNETYEDIFSIDKEKLDRMIKEYRNEKNF